MRDTPYSVGILPLGCKVSQYECEAIGEAFEGEGFVLRPFTEVCDVYLVNTCTVTAESDRKSRQVIRRAIKKNPAAIVMVSGCYSQTSPAEVAAIEGVSAVIGNHDKMSLPRIARELIDNKQTKPYILNTNIEEAPFEPMCITRAPRTRAYVKIEDGCECRCSYCAIPGARGRVRSKRPEDVIAEVEALSAKGTAEVVLTGIETASYGVDFDNGYRLIDLLEELDRRKSCRRIRLGSLSPEGMREDFVKRLSSLAIVVPHFHLSMQSGSDSVLRGMRRRYNREMALSALARLRARIPSVQFTTDMMVGFPGEGEAEFLETLDFVKKARFLDMHVFAYSRRKNTPAATYPAQVSEEEKHRRSQILIAEKNRIRDEILDTLIGEGAPLSVVVETVKDGIASAHAENFAELRFPAEGCEHGEVILVRPLSHADGVIFGEIKR